jgi:hypothetical protein
MHIDPRIAEFFKAHIDVMYAPEWSDAEAQGLAERKRLLKALASQAGTIELVCRSVLRLLDGATGPAARSRRSSTGTINGNQKPARKRENTTFSGPRA